MSEKEKDEMMAEDDAMSVEPEVSSDEEQEESFAPVDDIEKELVQAREEAADLKDRMLRLAAEFENYKKRNERERTMAMKYAGEPIFRELLPVVDNLERAIQQGKVEGATPESNLSGLLKGVELTLENLRTSLEKFEVKPVESVGGAFDPNMQEALTMEPSGSVPANHVVSEFEKGYFYKDRLLRAAKVIVSSGKAES